MTRLLAIAVLAAAAVGQSSHGPLRAMVDTADVAVLATVEAFHIPDSAELFRYGVATLRVREVCKGDVPSDTIEVHGVGDGDTLIITHTPEYRVGTGVLTFLDRNDESGQFACVSWSSGTKVLDDEGVRAYTAFIDELLAFDTTSAKFDKPALVELLVRMIENEHTRREGLQDFVADAREGLLGLSRALTSKQISRLVATMRERLPIENEAHLFARVLEGRMTRDAARCMARHILAAHDEPDVSARNRQSRTSSAGAVSAFFTPVAEFFDDAQLRAATEGYLRHAVATSSPRTSTTT